jgi:hypothetical protein
MIEGEGGRQYKRSRSRRLRWLSCRGDREKGGGVGATVGGAPPYTVWRSKGSGVVAANGGDVLETAAVEGEGGYDGNCMR